MSYHKPWVAGQDPWQGKCTCSARGPVVQHRWQADDWVRDHTEAVERARLHLRSAPSLTQTLNHFRKMEKTTDDPVRRSQWKMLADEIDLRLGNFPHPDDSPLF